MITEEQKKIIIDTMLPYKPTYIGIFGSYARGDNRDDSDIDILYLLQEAVGFAMFDMKDDLERLLHTKVDLVSKKYIKPRLKDYILNDVKVIYEVNY
jgi:predicted nucleotidyltransferase